MSNLKTLLKNHKQQIKRKTIIIAGSTIGLLLTTAVLEGLSRPKTTYILVEDPDMLDEILPDDTQAP